MSRGFGFIEGSDLIGHAGVSQDGFCEEGVYCIFNFK